MNPNWFGICCGLLAIAAFFLTYLIAGRGPRDSRKRWLWLTLLLMLPGMSFTLYYAHWITVPGWYYEFRSWPLTELWLVVTGGALGLLATFMHSVIRMLALLLTVLLSTAPFIKPFLAPFHDGAFKDLWDGAVCRQSTYSTCGAAAAASLLQHHGITVREETLAKEAHSYQGGTEIWYLARSLNKRGLTTHMNTREGLPDFLQEQENPSLLPAIVGVRFGQTGHFIAVLSRQGDQFHVGDPLRGSELLSREEFIHRYQFTGFYMTAKPRT